MDDFKENITMITKRIPNERVGENYQVFTNDKGKGVVSLSREQLMSNPEAMKEADRHFDMVN